MALCVRACLSVCLSWCVVVVVLVAPEERNGKSTEGQIPTPAGPIISAKLSTYVHAKPRVKLSTFFRQLWLLRVYECVGAIWEDTCHIATT